ncbi:MAG: enoyl-[acyl-carrier-protein] reductase FabK [Christensenellaceae bacterium]|jgi:enoyl-[acyl-carrier protein] reductase II|nr:enoyl-[acyl-carrier-protein] reductase FabK [Christensenellaceae bacterium]
MLHTPLCELLSIQYPIVQGGMAWVSEAGLAAAVSNAGGLGLISAMNAGPDYLRGEIQKCRAAVGNKPFGVNIMLMSPYADDVAQVVLDERVPVVATGAGMPAKYMPAWLEAGLKVLPVVPSVAIARRLERLGATAVVAEGCESGGHVGELTTMALVPQVVSALSIPVLAAGGIGDGRGTAAALMLGAQGVQLGTRFLTAKECPIHQNYKDKILQAKEIDTIVTGRRLGHPVRALKNRFTRRFAEMELEQGVTAEELEAFGVGSLRKAAIEGDTENGSFMAGQIAGLIGDEPSCAEIIHGIFAEAEALLKGAAQWLS